MPENQEHSQGEHQQPRDIQKSDETLTSAAHEALRRSVTDSIPSDIQALIRAKNLGTQPDSEQLSPETSPAENDSDERS